MSQPGRLLDERGSREAEKSAVKGLGGLASGVYREGKPLLDGIGRGNPTGRQPERKAAQISGGPWHKGECPETHVN